MTKNKIFLWVQTALCALIAILLAVAAVRIFLDGSAYQAAGHPSEWIYTREKVTAALMPILPLFLLSLIRGIYLSMFNEQIYKMFLRWINRQKAVIGL